MNSLAIAKKWVEFIATRPEFGAGEILLAQFSAGEVTSLCFCGCNGFEFKPACAAPPLAAPSEHGSIAFQLAFSTTNHEGIVEFMVFVDASGGLEGIDVDYCGNTLPMPSEVSLAEPPHHVYGKLALTHYKS